jgi:hypothetical protein
MANTILTMDVITKEALRILHQKLTFLGTINRQYDKSFAQTGAKAGNSIRIRKPNQYSVSRGPTLAAQDVVEESLTLEIKPQFQVGMNFSALDLTLSIDDFSRRFIAPAVSTMAANIEAEVLADMVKTVPYRVGDPAAAPTLRSFLLGEKSLSDALAPAGDRFALLSTSAQVELIDALKGLFNDSSQVSKQYRDGRMGRTAGLDFSSSTHMNATQRGTANGSYLVNGAGQSGSSLVVDTGTGTIKAGDTFTIAGVNRVHPETKASMGVLQQFTATEDYAGGAGTIGIFPAIHGPLSEGRQNVSALPADNAAITVAGTASAIEGTSLVYHKDAFTFATADLHLPGGQDMASRQVYEGISMRLVRDYVINDDTFPCRLDVLGAWGPLRPEHAVQIKHAV